MGKLFADFFKDRGLKVLISDRGTRLKNSDLAKKSDIVIVSVPIDKTALVIKEVLPFVKKSGAIMDFTSVKDMPVQEMLKGKCEVLGLHPMFGNSNPIPGQTVILCATEKSGKWSKWLEEFLKSNQVKIEKMSAREHDHTMNIAQGLIHFAEITFADALRRNKMPVQKLLKFTGKASELKVQLAARLLDQDAGLYGNIQIANPYALNSLLAYKKSVDELIKIVQKKDLAGFKKYFLQNRKFLGNYTKEAYRDSSYLIDQLLQLHKKKPAPKIETPTKNHIALLGPANTFTDMAATRYLQGRSLKKYFARDIDEVFELVEEGKVKEGIVPIENKLQGTVRETLDELFYRDVYIAQELNIPVHHCLITLAHAKKLDIRYVLSHSQALNQCREYLKENFPKAEKQNFSSTAAALQEMLAKNDKILAVIGPVEAVDSPNLKILAKNIEDEPDNSTTFIIIRKGKATNSGPKTSIAFHFSADAPGSLFSVFKDFADTKINLTKIESRPTKARFGDYIFYLDFEGGLAEPKVKKVLKAVGQKVARLKVLGSY